MPRTHQVALIFWVVLTLSLTTLYAVDPRLASPEGLVDLLRQSGGPVVLGYIGLSIVRAFTLIPSTVLIVVGTLLFPNQPWFVMASSMAGIVASAMLVYFFFEFLGLTALFERRHQSRVRWLENQMQRKGFWVVAAWSAFPFVPTDIICYVAGTLRMNVWVFLGGVALGELPLVTFYVLLGGALFGG